MASPETGPLVLADLSVGRRLQGRSITIGEWHVLTFAGLTGDYFPLHTDEEYAATTPFGGRIAHGLLTFVVGAGFLASELSGWDVVAALGFGETRFVAPVRFGDTITPVATVREVRPKDDRGVVDLDVVVSNQEDVPVVTSSMQILVRQ